MTAAAEWLAAKSKSYWDDAARFEREGIDAAGLTGEQWGIVYRTVSAELRKCASEERASFHDRALALRRDGFGDF